jgi:hypothetical protein
MILRVTFTDGQGTVITRTAEQWGEFTDWSDRIPFAKSGTLIDFLGTSTDFDIPALVPSMAPYGYGTYAAGGMGTAGFKPWLPPSSPNKCALQMVAFTTTSPVTDAGGYDIYLRLSSGSETKIGGFPNFTQPQTPIEFVPPPEEVQIVLKLIGTSSVYDVFGRLTFQPGKSYIGYTGKRPNGDGIYRKISRVFEDTLPE